MDYGRHLTDAFHLTWRQRGWWPLGLLLAVAALPQLVAARILVNRATSWSQIEEAALLAALEEAWRPERLIVWLLLLLVVGLAIWLVTAVAEGGLIWAVSERQAGRPAPLLAALTSGWRFLIRLIALDTVIFFPLFLLLLFTLLLSSGGLIGGILLLAQDAVTVEELMLLMAGVGGLFVCLSLLAVPVGLVTFLFRFVALRAAVVENLPAVASLHRTRQLFRQHWLTFVALALLLWVARYAVRLVASFALTPLQLVSLRLLLTPDSGGNLPAHFVGLVGDLGGFLLQAIMVLFSAVAWTVFYRAVILPEPERELST